MYGTDAAGARMVLLELLSANARTDTALFTGNLSEYESLKIETDPLVINKAVADKHTIMACGFPYGGKMYCSQLSQLRAMFFQLAGLGNLYPGMSGGPVIDMDTHTIIAVNSAVLNEWAIVAPLVALFEQLDVEANQ
jgi:hypothetical protein